MSSSTITATTSTSQTASSAATSYTEDSESYSYGKPVSAGAAVGIGIGSAVAGGLITAAVFLFLRWRRRNRREHLETAPKHASEQKPESQTLGSGALDTLPQPIPYSALIQDLSKLETAIKNFVDNFFHTQRASSDIREDPLIVLAGPAPDGVSWAARLLHPETRLIGLRSLIARAVFKRIDPRFDPMDTLLPVHVAVVYSSILAEANAINDGSSVPYFQAIWRQMTAYLLPLTSHSSRISEGESRKESIRSLASDITAATGPIRNQKSPERCLQVLEDLLGDAAILGFRLFSQADEWECSWSVPRRGGIVVFPGLNLLGHIKDSDEVQVTAISNEVVEN
ncbi:hypothetical protein BGZ63DRAFT_466926 [Mariannaea sp. PMI_226]|nr:hypothetical protein BGZ63DRAFT_466926 [Mariannaea sp. PMI_226]